MQVAVLIVMPQPRMNARDQGSNDSLDRNRPPDGADQCAPSEKEPRVDMELQLGVASVQQRVRRYQPGEERLFAFF